MKKPLLCTFCEEGSINMGLDYIQKYYDIVSGRVFLYEQEESPILLMFYNVENALKDNMAESTILVHRKVQSNTFYTINALNELIIELNGDLDKNYIVNWSDYSNFLLIIRAGCLEKIKLNFNRIIHF